MKRSVRLGVNKDDLKAAPNNCYAQIEKHFHEGSAEPQIPRLRSG
jgi:hypothetical protein